MVDSTALAKKDMSWKMMTGLVLVCMHNYCVWACKLAGGTCINFCKLAFVNTVFLDKGALALPMIPELEPCTLQFSIASPTHFVSGLSAEEHSLLPF